MSQEPNIYTTKEDADGHFTFHKKLQSRLMCMIVIAVNMINNVVRL